MILVLIPTILVVAASLLGFFGAWWWPLDLLANLRPQYGVVLAILGLVLVVGRWRRWGALTLVAAIVNLGLVAPLYLAPDRSGAVTGESLRVVSFNVRGDNRSYQPVIEYLSGLQADVVFLHEATEGWEAALEAADLPYQAFVTRRIAFGTLVLAPAEAEVVSFGFSVSEPRAVEVRLSTPQGRLVHLLGVHALSPDTEERARLRDAQLRFYAGWASRQTERSVVVGDLNATPWSHAFRHLERSGGLESSQRGFGIQASFPADATLLIRVPIDHLLYRGDLQVIDRRLGPPMGSDHLPLVVDLALTA